ncbi:YfiR family protein [Alkalimarinus alittae]|uniref:YfiR family protein n=1 Tax=Alkalimarinus alittae TaxID=2961619 RepID=A0ABY6N4T9_9ALTE|nr:YfiR family protein [Alkalimarinus alittae]UZE97131.1 YfiR family protein [Alkalimarinus alittae]
MLSQRGKSVVQIAILLLLTLSATVQARSENDVKAVYLYNFIKFITWPEEPTNSSINICIYGDNPFGIQSQKLNTLKVRNRPLQIIYPNKIDLPNCTVVFIAPSEEVFTGELLARINNSPILTISDIENFTEKGGMIGFIKLGNVVKFDINLKKARETNIQISSKLLELANHVIQ